MGLLKGNCNVGGTDRILRFGVGFGLLGAAWLARDINQWARIGMLVAAAESIYSAATRHCYLNEVLGRDTCQVPLLSETLAAEVDQRYPEMEAEAYDERAAESAEKLSLGLA